FARVAPLAHQDLRFEVELARRLAETESPVAALEPRVEPRVYEHDGFAVTLWTYYEPVTPPDVSPADYASALERLHAGMRKLKVASPHFTDRVAEAQQLVASRDLTPALTDADRELLIDALRKRRRAISDRAAPEQLVHGEPHPGNVLATRNGPLFIDFETCCRGPVEFDPRPCARSGQRVLSGRRSRTAPRLLGPRSPDGRSMALGPWRPVPGRAERRPRPRPRATPGSAVANARRANADLARFLEDGRHSAGGP